MKTHEQDKNEGHAEEHTSLARKVVNVLRYSPATRVLSQPMVRAWKRAVWELCYRRNRRCRKDRPAFDVTRCLEEIVATPGVRVERYWVDAEGYRRYLRDARYREGSYGSTFAEKTLEHYVSACLLALEGEDVLLDVASQYSPFPDIAKRLFGCKTVWRQDLAYRAGIHGDRIGSNAIDIPLPDASVTKMTLHCSFEHFEGDDDVGFVREAARLLSPGGRACILPLYMADEYVQLTDPTVRRRGLRLDADAETVCVFGYNNRFGRFYTPEKFAQRVVANARGLTVTVVAIADASKIDPSCYLQLAVRLEKLHKRAHESGG